VDERGDQVSGCRLLRVPPPHVRAAKEVQEERARHLLVRGKREQLLQVLVQVELATGGDERRAERYSPRQPRQLDWREEERHARVQLAPFREAVRHLPAAAGSHDGDRVRGHAARKGGARGDDGECLASTLVVATLLLATRDGLKARRRVSLLPRGEPLRLRLLRIEQDLEALSRALDGVVEERRRRRRGRSPPPA